jgi:hypothetical protein
MKDRGTFAVFCFLAALSKFKLYKAAAQFEKAYQYAGPNFLAKMDSGNRS